MPDGARQKRSVGLPERALERPVTTLMIFLALVVTGVIASKMLPLAKWPELDIPFIFVQIPYPNATPGEVEEQITRPVEEALATLPGITRMRSNSRADSADVQLEFQWGQEVAMKAVAVREKLEAVRKDLPADVRFMNVFKFSTGDEPVLQLRISSKSRNLENSWDLLNRQLVRRLERLPGVARVDLEGVEAPEVRIDLINDRIAAYGVDLNDLQRRMQAANFSASAGTLTADGARWHVNPGGRFSSLDQIRSFPINSQGLRLSDVADVEMGPGRRNYERHLNQRYAIGLSVYKDRGANLVEVGTRVLEEVEAAGKEKEMQGIDLFFLENEAASVHSSINDLFKAGMLGALLSVIVLYLFVRSLPVTLMVTLAVPISLAMALGALYFLHMNLNILSMMGLMLAVGMLVDNAVVVSEAIFTEREKTPHDHLGAAKRGVNSVALAVLAGTFTTAIVFLPNLFGAQDNISIFLRDVSVTIVVSLAASLLIAQTVIPLLASRLPPPGARRETWVDQLRERYARFLAWSLRHRWKMTGFALAAVVSVAVPAHFVKSEAFQEDESRSLFMRFNLDGDYPLDVVRKSVDKVEDYLYKNQDEFQIRAVYSYFDENGTAQSSILLREDGDGLVAASQIKKKIRAGLPKLPIAKPSFGFNRQGNNDKLTVSLSGDSSRVLAGLVGDAESILSHIQGVVDVRRSERDVGRELGVRVDRAKAMALGFSTRDVAGAIAVAMRGVTLSNYASHEGEVPIKLGFRDRDKQRREQLADIRMSRPDGSRVPLTSMVHVGLRDGSQTIRRLNRKTSVELELGLQDLTTEEARKSIKSSLDKMALPAGYRWKFGSGFDQDRKQQQKMVKNIFLAMIFVYMVMAALFESLVSPFVIMTTIVFSIVGVYWFLLATGTSMTIMAMIGILVLIGVVVNNGIVLIDHINRLRWDGLGREAAIVQAGRDRLRPILMTVGTTVLGLLPLAFGGTKLGGDGPAYFPMARAIVGGLAFSTVVSLIVLPTIYLLFEDATGWLRWITHRRFFNKGLTGRRKAEA